jgi:5-methylcytosine-specific restriction enzyme subunit McrC
MNKTFEEFVAARLTRYLSLRLAVISQDTRQLDADGRVKIIPDLIFERGTGRAVYVADTKYKITADGYGREADYYQILAYTTALDLPAGMLIYCQRDGDIPPREIRVRGKKLATWPLRLDGAPSDVESQIQRLAEEIARRAVLGHLA